MQLDAEKNFVLNFLTQPEKNLPVGLCNRRQKCDQRAFKKITINQLQGLSGQFTALSTTSFIQNPKTTISTKLLWRMYIYLQKGGQL